MTVAAASWLSTEFRPLCQSKFVHWRVGGHASMALFPSNYRSYIAIAGLFLLTHRQFGYIIIITHMPKPDHPSDDSKAGALRASGALHSNPDAVQDEAFLKHEFFDPRDRVQVKYEMLRRRSVDGRPIAEVARSFGVSRQAFYKTDAVFKSQGIPGLLPHRRGPKRAHKCTDDILDFVEQRRAAPLGDSDEDVAQAVHRRFGVSIHPRTIERALAKRKKKRRGKPGSQP